MATVTATRSGTNGDGNTNGDHEWIYADEAAAILDVPRNKIWRLGQRGVITVKKPPQTRPRYRRDEIERIAAASVRSPTRPATKAKAK